MKRSYVALVLEEIRGQCKVFGEGLAGLREKNGEEHKEIKESLELLRDGVGDLRVRTALVEAKLARLEESNARIEDDIRIIKNNIKVKVDLEEFKVLENRLVVLEKRFAVLEK